MFACAWAKASRCIYFFSSVYTKYIFIHFRKNQSVMRHPVAVYIWYVGFILGKYTNSKKIGKCTPTLSICPAWWDLRSIWWPQKTRGLYVRNKKTFVSMQRLTHSPLGLITYMCCKYWTQQTPWGYMQTCFEKRDITRAIHFSSVLIICLFLSTAILFVCKSAASHCPGRNWTL